MEKARNILLWIIGIIFLLSVALNVYHFATESSSSASTSDTTRVTIYDTIPFIKPNAKDSGVVGYITERLPVADVKEDNFLNNITDTIAMVVDSEVVTDCHRLDSVKVSIPITQKVYEDSTYKAYVSGFKPSLDSIFFYPKTEVQTITTKDNDKSRWSLSVSLGYGLTLTKQPTFAPMASVNISYNLYTFPKLRKIFKKKRKQITY